MAKSDLLKEAIADAKAVKETALANAKIALQEAFQPRIKSMLENELISELEDDELEMDAEMMAGDEEMDAPAEPMDDMGMDDMDVDAEEPMDVGDIEIDTDMDGEIDFTGDIMTKPGAGMEDDMDDMGDMDMEEPMDDELAGDEMGLEEIIKELEEDLNEVDEMYVNAEKEEVPMGETYSAENGGKDNGNNGIGSIAESQSIDELIEAILAEEEIDEADDPKESRDKLNAEELPEGGRGKKVDETACGKKNEELTETLEEAYHTVAHLKSVINEVNLLNAKLLYTNKLFRNFDLNEGQKMKVIENFDRAANTREAKLVFSTLAESFQKPTKGKRKVVKESKSLASKPVATTAPSKQTTQVLSEGFEQANRWKKLAGLIK
jgi:hypothetical protein